MIVVGKVLDSLAATVRTRVVPHRQIGFDVRHGYSHEPLELRSAQPASLPVTLGHDWGSIVGSVRHLEASGNPGMPGRSATCMASCPTSRRSSSRSRAVAAALMALC